jgi:hypothetical protein
MSPALIPGLEGSTPALSRYFSKSKSPISLVLSINTESYKSNGFFGVGELVFDFSILGPFAILGDFKQATLDRLIEL